MTGTGKFCATAVLATGLISAGMVFGQGQGTTGDKGAYGYKVLELYTSQGCSACPPADDLLHSLKNRTVSIVEDGETVSFEYVPLAFHVDYWDYLGWTDTMAESEFSLRQMDYARQRQQPMVYTPQMIIQGQEFVIGSNEQAIDNALKQVDGAIPLDYTVSSTDDGTFQITINKEFKEKLAAGDYDVFHVRYFTGSHSVEPEDGENRDTNVAYTNIVTEFIPIGTWSNKTNTSTGLTLKGITEQEWKEKNGWFPGEQPAGDQVNHLLVLQEPEFGNIVGLGMLDGEPEVPVFVPPS